MTSRIPDRNVFYPWSWLGNQHQGGVQWGPAYTKLALPVTSKKQPQIILKESIVILDD